MKRTLAPQTIKASIVPGSYNEKENTIDVVFATETPVFRRQWDGEFNEVLLCGPENVRLERFNNGAAVVDTHITTTIKAQFGVVTRAWLQDQKAYASLLLSDREEWRGVTDDIKRGIIRNVSVQYRVYQARIIEHADTIPELQIIEWEPTELTFCSVPADHYTGTRTLDKENEVDIIYQNTRSMPEKEEVKTDVVVIRPVNQIDPTRVIEDAERQGTVKERQRQRDIRDLVRAVSLEDGFADELIEAGHGIDHARALIVARKADSQAAVKPQIHNVTITGADESVKERAALEYALLNRADATAYRLDDDNNRDAVLARKYTGISVLDTARTLLINKGEKVAYSKAEIIQRAMTSSDFPELLSAIGNKFLRREYQNAAQTFKVFSRQQNLPDFKESKGIQFGGIPTLEQVLEDGEYKGGSFTETVDGWKLATYGKMFKFSRQMMINDDLGGYKRQASLVAKAAGNLESKMVWNLIVNNVKVADGKALFDAAHKNLKTGGTFDVDGLSAARLAMRRQKGLNEEEIIEIMPKYLVVPPELETKAEQLVSSIVANTTGDVNVFSGKFQVLSEIRLSDPKAWHLFSDFSTVEGITYGYLEGQEGLHTETRESWHADGVELKARIDFGVKCWDFRGFYKTIIA